MNLGKLGSLTTTSQNSLISLNSLFYNATGNPKIALPLFKIGDGEIIFVRG